MIGPNVVALPTEWRGTPNGGTPNGIRTRAATLKGWCPRPLDDGGLNCNVQQELRGRAAGI